MLYCFNHLYKSFEIKYKDKWKSGDFQNSLNLRNNFRDNLQDSHFGCLSIEIVPSDVCQLKCKYCYLGKEISQTKNTSFNNYNVSFLKDIISQASEKYNQKKLFGKIAFLGGEPTLHPNICDLIQYTKNKGLKPILVTNGFKLFDTGFVKEILQLETEIVMHLPFYPINTISSGDYNNIVNNPYYSQYLQKAWENILTFRTKNNLIFGEFVIHKKSIKYVYDSYVFCRKNAIEPFFERMRLSNDKIYNRQYIIAKRSFIQIGKAILTYDYNNNYINTNIPKDIRLLLYLSSPIIGKNCFSLSTGLYMNNQGIVSSCCGQTIEHGNIFMNSLKDILEIKEKNKIFMHPEKYLQHPCNQCFILKMGLCNGGCRGDANIQLGSPIAPYPQCIFLKKINK